MNYLPDLEFCFVFWHGDYRYRIRGNLTVMYNLMAVTVVVVCQGEALEAHQGLAPGADLLVAWVFGPES